MRTAIPTELLLRLMNATPAQFAAVEKVLAHGHHVELPAPVGEDVARAAFALLVKLDAQGKQKSPTPLTVFRFYCADGMSADEVATKCRCAKGTVMSRLRFIESVTHTKPEQFRAMSGHLQQMADDYDASGAREIYRRGLVDGAESDGSTD
jgi:hypothetical protein